MLNKKKVAMVLGIFIILLVLIGVILVVNANKKTKVSKLYDDLIKNQTYLFNMKNDNNYEITVAKKDSKTCIDNNGEERTTTLIKDGTTYLISHSSKEYYIYNSNVEEENIITDMLQGLKEEKCNKGKEKINGRSYKYEEYNSFAGFMTSTSKDIDENTVKTRFYFDGNKLVYIKTLLDGEEELLETQVSHDVPEELFEIPSDYAESN